MLKQFLQKRRATRQLADALEARDLESTRQALEGGADVERVAGTFDEPMQHFRMSYTVVGGLGLALEHRLPAEFFQLLLERGATVPSRADGSPDLSGIVARGDDERWAQSIDLAGLVAQSRAQKQGGSGPPQAPRQPGAPRA